MRELNEFRLSAMPGEGAENWTRWEWNKGEDGTKLEVFILWKFKCGIVRVVEEAFIGFKVFTLHMMIENCWKFRECRGRFGFGKGRQVKFLCCFKLLRRLCLPQCDCKSQDPEDVLRWWLACIKRKRRLPEEIETGGLYQQPLIMFSIVDLGPCR